MTITVNMSKEEFTDYLTYNDFKTKVKCGIINLEEDYNALLRLLLEDGIWEDNNKYGKVIDKINKDINEIEQGGD